MLRHLSWRFGYRRLGELNVSTQVKQYEHVGRVDVDKLETAIERHFDSTRGVRGYLIGFSFTRDAHDPTINTLTQNPSS